MRTTRQTARLKFVEGLASKVRPDRAGQFVDRLLFASARSTNPYHTSDLIHAISAFPGPLTEQQAAATLRQLFDSARKTIGPDQSDALATALAALATELPAAHREVARARMLSAIANIRNDGPLLVKLLEALIAPSARLDEATAGTLVSNAVKAIVSGSEETKHRRIAVTVAPRLSPKGAEQLLSTILNSVVGIVKRGVVETDALSALSEILAALPARPTPAQSVAVTEPVLDAMAGAANTAVNALEEVYLWGRIELLVNVLRGLPGRMTDTQSNRALDSVVAMMKGDRSQAGVTQLAETLTGLAGKLTPAYAQNAFQALIDARAETPETDLAPSGRPVAALTDAVDSQFAATAMLPVANGHLAWSRDPDEAVASAAAVAAVLRRAAHQTRINGLVQALKYPSAAGAPTGLLLDALREAAPEIPGSAASLSANIDVIADRYRGLVDLDAVPPCPVPPRPGLSCPSESP